MACWEGMIIVQDMTLDKAIPYSWLSYKDVPLVMTEDWAGKASPQGKSFTTVLLKIIQVHVPGTREQ